LLAFILEKATGMNVSDYATQKLWQPLALKTMPCGVWMLLMVKKKPIVVLIPMSVILHV
jgi:hypothetical protein